MKHRTKYFQLFGFLTLFAFLLSNSNPLFFQSEILEEEEQRVETEESENDRFLADQQGNSGFNIIPDIDAPAILPAEFESGIKRIEFANRLNFLSTQTSQARLPKFFILFHNLKLDFC